MAVIPLSNLNNGGEMQFRKRPVVIDAFRMGIDNRPDWFCDKVTTNEIITHYLTDADRHAAPGKARTWCEIKTLEGVMIGDYGDWIIRGVAGEIYPCKPGIFDQTYEPAEGPSERDKLAAQVAVLVDALDLIPCEGHCDMLSSTHHQCGTCGIKEDAIANLPAAAAVFIKAKVVADAALGYYRGGRLSPPGDELDAYEAALAGGE